MKRGYTSIFFMPIPGRNYAFGLFGELQRNVQIKSILNACSIEVVLLYLQEVAIW